MLLQTHHAAAGLVGQGGRAGLVGPDGRGGGGGGGARPDEMSTGTLARGGVPVPAGVAPPPRGAQCGVPAGVAPPPRGAAAAVGAHSMVRPSCHVLL